MIFQVKENKNPVKYGPAEVQGPIEALFRQLQTAEYGLVEAEARGRLAENGLNEVAREKAPHPLVQLALAFNNPFIYILLTLSLISFYTDFWLPWRAGEETDLTGVLIVLVMVGASGLVRFWQEYRSNRAAESLKAMVSTTATVMRRQFNGPAEKREIAMKELVVGDVVCLAAGDMVPADVRLLESRDLFVSQAVLTGESIPVEKYDTMGEVRAKSSRRDALAPTEQSEAGEAWGPEEGGFSLNNLLESQAVCFMGSNVVSGTAKALVIAVGEGTYFGSLAKKVIGSRAQTAFDRGVNSVSWLLIRFMMVMVPVVLLINGLTKGNWSEAFMFALAVAVGLTPEMLPMIVSANLAKGALAMSRRKVVVKRLNAIQNFGAMNVLCTDKTGTLTQDRIILERHVDPSGRACENVLRLAWLNSFHQTGLRNLMDRAIVRFAEDHPEGGLDKDWKKIDELPFDFVRRRLSVIISPGNSRHKLICKGAVEEMLAVSAWVRENGQRLPLDDGKRAALLKLAEDYSRGGFRVLILASRDFDQIKEKYDSHDEDQLVIEGLLTFLDPPKDSAEPAIAALRKNGVEVKVLTGDTEVISAKICREVGLEPGRPIAGEDLERMEDGELRVWVERCDLFVKLTPMQKSRIIKCLQDNGHTVGFLGDGINDAAALRDADVGISVDSAADIAKESADIILLEKSLMVLEEGVLKGRETFGNIMKYLNMTASSNFGNVFSVLAASAFIPFLPMLAVHLLIQNLMYDFSQLSLPWDRVDSEFLGKPRKWSAENIRRFMIWIGPTSSVFDISTYALMWFVFGADNPEMQSLFQSGWFVEGLLSQTLVVHMLRTRKIPFIQSTAALPVLLTTGLVMALGIYVPFSPLGAMVGLQPLPWSYFPWLAATLLCYCLLAQSMKSIYMRKFGQWY